MDPQQQTHTVSVFSEVIISNSRLTTGHCHTHTHTHSVCVNVSYHESQNSVKTLTASRTKRSGLLHRCSGISHKKISLNIFHWKTWFKEKLMLGTECFIIFKSSCHHWRNSYDANVEKSRAGFCATLLFTKNLCWTAADYTINNECKIKYKSKLSWKHLHMHQDILKAIYFCPGVMFRFQKQTFKKYYLDKPWSNWAEIIIFLYIFSIFVAELQVSHSEF